MKRRGPSGGIVQTLVAAAVALVVGLALGGMSPRSELRMLRAELEQLKDRPCTGSSGVGREIASAFAGRPWQPDAEDRGAPRPDKPEPVAQEPGDEASSGVKVDFGGNDGEPPSPEQVEEGLDMARDAMRLRRTQAMAALKEGAAPDASQQEQIDGAIADMNAELRTLAEDFVATMRDTEGEPSRRDAMLFAADTLDVLIEADDRIFESLSPDQRAATEPEALDPMSYVDSSLVDVFMELDQR